MARLLSASGVDADDAHWLMHNRCRLLRTQHSSLARHSLSFHCPGFFAESESCCCAFPMGLVHISSTIRLPETTPKYTCTPTHARKNVGTHIARPEKAALLTIMVMMMMANKQTERKMQQQQQQAESASTLAGQSLWCGLVRG